jgi:aryl-alcohol dehydrogenase-like predicted oxidoreductase
MEYRPLGRTGVKVSQICLGTMMFGGKTDEPESFRMIDHAIDRGVNFIDTADVYAGNESERIVGKALAKENKRENIILATKFNFAHGADINAQGLSRRHVISACDASLKRLKTDWIDLYQMHRCRSDVPIDETLRALDDLIRAGKIRYIGGSMFPSWRIVESLWVAKELGLNRLICEQPAYHLLDRTAEREVIPAAQSFGLAVIPWGPLCGGLLSGKYASGQSVEGARWQNGKDNANRRVTEKTWNILALLQEMADNKNCSVSQLALAWNMAQPGVTAPIIGPRTFEQVEDNLGAVEVQMTKEDFARIDEVAAPKGYTVRYYDEANAIDFNAHTQRSVV